jgi:hypothetical protein
MKVYIVTDGTYSDYMIERVFSTREAAEEYRQWKRICNEVEEYEVHDNAFTTEDGDKAMFIEVRGTVYKEGVVNITYDIRRALTNDDTRTRGSGVYASNPDSFSIYTYRYIPVDRWDEEKYKDKLTKSLYDLAAMAKDMFADGASPMMVDRALYDEVKETEDE